MRWKPLALRRRCRIRPALLEDLLQDRPGDFLLVGEVFVDGVARQARRAGDIAQADPIDPGADKQALGDLQDPLALVLAVAAVGTGDFGGLVHRK